MFRNSFRNVHIKIVDLSLRLTLICQLSTIERMKQYFKFRQSWLDFNGQDNLL